jgi:glycosyltransferase involved in cell wall biosynthesis
MSLEAQIAAIKEKATVLPLGLDFTAIDSAQKVRHKGPPVVVWNHRWEHDKNPELFFDTLLKLDNEGVDFGLIVLGQSFERQPEVFEKAREQLKHRIVHFGYAESKPEYAKWLAQGDIVVSTAAHEFFGISVVEAVRAGCRPLLPRRLSYPEMFPDEFLYDDASFAQRLKQEILRGERLSPEASIKLTDGFSWDSIAPKYEMWIQNARIWKNTGNII